MSNVKEYYENVFLKDLKNISNEEAQKIAWKSGKYQSFSTYGEVTDEFITSCEYVLNSYQHFLLVETQKEKLQKLYDMVENYDNTIDELDDSGWRKKKTDKQIYNDPKWHDIQRYAQEVYDELKNIKINT